MRISVTPTVRAAAIVVVARRTSNTTTVEPGTFNRGNSLGRNATSTFMWTHAKAYLKAEPKNRCGGRELRSSAASFRFHRLGFSLGRLRRPPAKLSIKLLFTRHLH